MGFRQLLPAIWAPRFRSIRSDSPTRSRTLDLERDKVVNDLRFSGCTDAVYYVERPNLAAAFESDYRRGVSTDGRVAVVVLNDCQSPHLDLKASDQPRRPSLFWSAQSAA